MMADNDGKLSWPAALVLIFCHPTGWLGLMFLAIIMDAIFG